MSSTIIHVGGQDPQFQSFADYCDGDSAVVHRVTIRIDETRGGAALVISPPEQADVIWPLADIRRVRDQAARDVDVVRLRSDPVSRLLISDAEARRIIAARCENLNRRPPVENRSRLVVWSLGAVASVVLIIFVLVPLMADQLAGFLPPKGEQALGDATFEQIRRALGEDDFVPLEICDTAAGTQALATMQARLDGQLDVPYPLRVQVLDDPLVNAFALPGGRVVLFRGLIDAAAGPDEVAAVLAHEIGHVANRDPARGALRSAGSIGVLGLLFGDFAGGTVVLFMLNRLIDASYSQQAEALADSFAHNALIDAGIAPSSLATFFERLVDDSEQPTGIAAHFLAHPAMGDRIAAARNADSLLAGPVRPSLNASDWRALQRICQSGGGTVEKIKIKKGI